MFNVEVEVNGIIDFIRSYYKKHNLKGAVIGISGGKDSAVVAGLFVKALGSENVIGVTLPCNSLLSDKDDAKKISEHYGFKLFNLELTSVFESFKNEFSKEFNFDKLKDSDINLKPRLRMASLYYIAQAISSFKNEIYIVAGTSNYSESYVGYFTKGGDNISDISVLGNFLVSEVIKIGEYINVPKEILYKAPSDGLSSLTDEEKLGVTYNEIENYINGEETINSERIKYLHDLNSHKFYVPTYNKKN